MPTFLFGQETLDASLDVSEDTNYGWDLALSLGASFYQGDLHCFKDEDLSRFSNGAFSFGISAGKQINPVLGFRVGFNNSTIKGNDLDFSVKSGHRSRGLSFENNVTQIDARIDYMPLGRKKYSLQPYAFAGIGGVIGSADLTRNITLPKALDDAITEDEKESANGLIFPVGLGLKYEINEKVSVGVEGMMTLGTNDYLDGVSKSASTSYKDYMGNLSVKFGYRL